MRARVCINSMCKLMINKILQNCTFAIFKEFFFSQSYSKGMQAGLNEDTLGGTLKCGLAQYVALEITRGNNRENRAVARYLPWLYTAPSTIQQGYAYFYSDQFFPFFLLVYFFFLMSVRFQPKF